MSKNSFAEQHYGIGRVEIVEVGEEDSDEYDEDDLGIAMRRDEHINMESIQRIINGVVAPGQENRDQEDEDEGNSDSVLGSVNNAEELSSLLSKENLERPLDSRGSTSVEQKQVEGATTVEYSSVKLASTTAAADTALLSVSPSQLLTGNDEDSAPSNSKVDAEASPLPSSSTEDDDLSSYGVAAVRHMKKPTRRQLNYFKFLTSSSSSSSENENLQLKARVTTTKPLMADSGEELVDSLELTTTDSEQYDLISNESDASSSDQCPADDDDDDDDDDDNDQVLKEKEHLRVYVCSIKCRTAFNLIPTIECILCESKFHARCAGIPDCNTEEVTEIKDFICRNCMLYNSDVKDLQQASNFSNVITPATLPHLTSLRKSELNIDPHIITKVVNENENNPTRLSTNMFKPQVYQGPKIFQ